MISCLDCGRICSVTFMIKHAFDCPYFLRRLSLADVAKAVGKSKRTIIRWESDRIIKEACENGYIIIVRVARMRRKFYGGKLKNG